MSQSTRQKKKRDFLYRLFCPKETFLTFVFYLNVQCINPLSANPTKWSNTLKQFDGKLPMNCLSVFDHFVGLELNGLGCAICRVRRKEKNSICVLSGVRMCSCVSLFCSQNHPSQSAFTFSKLIIKTLEQGVKYVQS